MWTLEELGWDEGHEKDFAPFAARGLLPGRVAVAHRGAVLVYGPQGEVQAGLAGRLLMESEPPAVGDWVAVTPPEAGASRVEAVLPRRTELVRRAAGKEERPQVLAANLDVVFLVVGLDGDFNPRRVERALVAVADGGARAVVLLNKADKAPDVAAQLEEMRRAAPGVPVAAISAKAGTGLEVVEAELRPGRTAALIGSSGAGKSTLANRLLGTTRQQVQEVREHDSRGRHTTTRRELLVLPGGGLLMDTPGLRELQLWASPASGAEAFTELAELAAACRFGDCAHKGEPGCAVAAAVAEGRLEPERLASFHKLQGELRQAETRVDARARSDQERRWRVIHKAARKHKPRG